MTIKYLSYLTINSTNPYYLVISIKMGILEQSNGNKYLRLISVDESKD